MNRTIALAAALVVAGTALADIAPPPPPKGQKYVSVSSEVRLGKEMPGYVFVVRTATGPGAPKIGYERVELSDKAAKKVATGGQRNTAALVAIPPDVAKEYKTDAELFDALKDDKVKGAGRLVFAGTATVSDALKGDAVTWTYTVTAIDGKGIKAAVEGEGYKPRADAPGKPDGEDEEAAAPAPRGGAWVAGMTAALAVALGGLWVAGRGRRKV